MNDFCGFAFILWNHMLRLTSISNRNDFRDCWCCCCCFVFHQLCFISIYGIFKQNVFIENNVCVVGTSLSHPRYTFIFTKMQAIQMIEKNHAASDFRLHIRNIHIRKLKWYIKRLKYFSITTYAMAQKDMNDIFQVHWKHTYKSQTNESTKYDCEKWIATTTKKWDGKRYVLAYKSHLQAHAPHHCTPQSRRCNNDHRHQITAR